MVKYHSEVQKEALCMKRPGKFSPIATGLYKEFSVHPKLKTDMPRGCVLATRDVRTRVVNYLSLGELARIRVQNLQRLCDGALEALEEKDLFLPGEFAISPAGIKAKNGDQFVLAGMKHDLAELYLGVYLVRFTLLTPAKVQKIWEESGNKYIIGNTILL
jgi:hypothetical protein